jgi:hypothetical protein
VVKTKRKHKLSRSAASAGLDGWRGTSCGCDTGNDNVVPMEYDKDKVDEVVLALLYLTLHEGDRAWKGHDWDAMNRLHAKGMIGDPVGKAKSVWLTEEGLQRSRELFMQHFGGGKRSTI